MRRRISELIVRDRMTPELLAEGSVSSMNTPYGEQGTCVHGPDFLLVFA